jgi:hypothetical protein
MMRLGRLRAALEDTTDELRQLRGVTLRRRIAFSGMSSGGEIIQIVGQRHGHWHGAGDLAGQGRSSPRRWLFRATPHSFIQVDRSTHLSPTPLCTTTPTYVYRGSPPGLRDSQRGHTRDSARTRKVNDADSGSSTFSKHSRNRPCKHRDHHWSYDRISLWRNDTSSSTDVCK